MRRAEAMAPIPPTIRGRYPDRQTVVCRAKGPVVLSCTTRPLANGEDGRTGPSSVLYPLSARVKRSYSGPDLRTESRSVTDVVVAAGQGPQAGGGCGIAVAVADVVDGRREVVDRIHDVVAAGLGVGGERRGEHLHQPQRRVGQVAAGGPQVGGARVERRLVLGDRPQGRGPGFGSAGP